MYYENQKVMTPKGKGTIVYIEDDFVSVELDNGAEMDFTTADLSAEIEEKVVEEKEFEWLATPAGSRLHASVALDIMTARADGILQERFEVLKGHLRHISSALGKKNCEEILKIRAYVLDRGEENCPLKAIRQDWKRELFLYALFMGSHPSTLANLEKEEIRERFAIEMGNYLKVQSGDRTVLIG